MARILHLENVEGVLRKLTDDTPAIPVVTLPSHTDVPVPNAYMNAAAPATPQEVQTLLLSETVTVTDLSMGDDPLGFDSDESAIFYQHVHLTRQSQPGTTGT
jgi:hypothetical protein